MMAHRRGRTIRQRDPGRIRTEIDRSGKPMGPLEIARSRDAGGASVDQGPACAANKCRLARGRFARGRFARGRFARGM